MFFSVLLSGLLAMNYFEPLAESLQGMYPSWGYRFDFIALTLLFAVFVLLFRLLTIYILPNYIEIHTYAYEAGRWGFGLLTGWVTMAFLLTSLHTAPLPREFLGFRPENKNFFGAVAPDRQWLGFVQFLSEKNLARFGAPRIFDGRQENVLGVQNTTWPSFPIKYASRRGQDTGTLESGSSAKAGRGWTQDSSKDAETIQQNSSSGTAVQPGNGGRRKTVPAF